MSNPTAVVTVALSRPVTGSELIATVKKLSESGRRYGPFYEEECSLDDNGKIFTIGQSSEYYPYQHLLVTPSQEEVGIRPNQTYGRVTVMSHKWPVLVTAQVGYDDSDVISSVHNFAKQLEQHFMNSFGQSTDVSA